MRVLEDRIQEHNASLLRKTVGLWALSPALGPDQEFGADGATCFGSTSEVFELGEEESG